MAFFGLQEALLASGNRLFVFERVRQVLNLLVLIVMRCVGRFYTIAKNDIFLVEKAVKQFFIYFSMTGGASSYDKSMLLRNVPQPKSFAFWQDISLFC